LSDFSPQNEIQPTPETAPEAEPAKQDWKGFVREIFETLALAIVLFLVINFVSARVRVDGYSMKPTLDNNEYVLVSRLSYKLGDFRRGDIIVFRPPMYPEASWVSRLFGFPLPGEAEDYIKRIIGLPDDTVSVENGIVSINGFALTEPYIAAPPEYTGSWQVPAGQVFVLGDNRNNSSDSHVWGFLPVENILGRALVIYWPFSNWMILKSNQAVLAAP
jgi:signal peptidase I